MKTIILRSVSLLLTLVFVLSGCKFPEGIGVDKTPTTIPQGSAVELSDATSEETPTPPDPTEPPTETPSPTPSPTPTPVVFGPDTDGFPESVNPLTGLVVTDPALLQLPAVLISITNFPPSARPQSGLSFASWVYELYISEGMTRFLTVFYGNYPTLGQPNSQDPLALNPADPNVTETAVPFDSGQVGGNGEDQNNALSIGPVRSGRLPWAYIRDFFQNSCLVYAGATIQIQNKLKGCSIVYGSDASDINSAMVSIDHLKDLALKNADPNNNFNYSGNLFTELPPEGGEPASILEVFYSFLNQSKWEYDPATGRFLKFEDFADGSGNFRPMTDRINGEQLAFSNVIVIYADHEVLDPFIIDVNLQSGEKGKAVVFRDGLRYDVIWTTMNGEYERSSGLRRPMRFEYPDGTPFPLKPGQSWVHIFTHFSYIEDKGEGNWLLRFIAPAGTF